MSGEWAGQTPHSNKRHYPIRRGIDWHRIPTADRSGRAISTHRLRTNDFRSRRYAHSRAIGHSPWWVLYRVTVLTASLIGASYGFGEFLVACMGR